MLLVQLSILWFLSFLEFRNSLIRRYLYNIILLSNNYVEAEPLGWLKLKCVCVCFVFSRATSTAYGDSQARDLIGAVAAVLRQSHSNVGSKPRL